MTDEEKEAIWYCGEILADNEDDRINWNIVLNLIEKQQNEIEKLKIDYKVLEDDLKDHRIAYTDTPEFEEKWVSKDRVMQIRDKLENLDIYIYGIPETLRDLNKLLGDEEDDR